MCLWVATLEICGGKGQAAIIGLEIIDTPTETYKYIAIKTKCLKNKSKNINLYKISLNI